MDYHLTPSDEDGLSAKDDVTSRFWIWSAVLVLASTVLSAQAPVFTSRIDLVPMGVSWSTASDGDVVYAYGSRLSSIPRVGC